jgi:predicted alpha/beta superfamily hydrolase
VRTAFSRRAALTAGAASAALIGASAGKSKKIYALPNSEVLSFTSKSNGVDYLLYVRPPAKKTDKPPLVLTLDADYQFSIAANHLEHLSNRMNQAPHAVVASVAYPGQYPDDEKYRATRTRDYTPIFWPDGGYGPKFQENSGGGPKFQKALADEILPLLESRFGTDPHERLFVGHSYGGLFGAWTLQSRPHLFNRYLLVSPSLWYADQLILKGEASAKAAALSQKTRVYLAVGSWEEQPENNQRMVSELERFADLLRARGDENLVVKHRVFEDETHASIFPAAFSTGLRHLYLTI